MQTMSNNRTITFTVASSCMLSLSGLQSSFSSITGVLASDVMVMLFTCGVLFAFLCFWPINPLPPTSKNTHTHTHTHTHARAYTNATLLDFRDCVSSVFG